MSIRLIYSVSLVLVLALAAILAAQARFRTSQGPAGLPRGNESGTVKFKPVLTPDNQGPAPRSGRLMLVANS